MNRRRPLLLTGPYLAMWLWLIVPLTLHGLMPLGASMGRHLSFHLGAWIEEVKYAYDFRHGMHILRKDRTYNQCRYIQFGGPTTKVVLLPAKRQDCSFVRITRDGTGQTVLSVSNAELIQAIKRAFK